MQYPLLLDKVDSILLYDPLSDFSGAFEEGFKEIQGNFSRVMARKSKRHFTDQRVKK